MNTIFIRTPSKNLHNPALLLMVALMLQFFPQVSGAQVSLAIDPLITGLSEPVDIVHAGDDSGRLFIVERAGRIRIWDGASLLPVPFLDITALTTTDSERGLLSLAFHPQFAVNGRLFVHYTDLTGGTVLAEYALGADSNQAEFGSAVVLLQANQPFANHNGGQIRFGPDGFLYMALGDGGSGGDPINNGQNLATLLGKILRIDVDGPQPYGIPADNPFAGQAGARPEIWAFGLRNPWRFSFDRLTGDLFIADVGQNLFEEVNFQPAASIGGENYGWRLMEAAACFNPPTGCETIANLTLPILTYGRGTGSSVTGGYVYRGQQFPELAGHYIFGDFGSGRIFAAERQADGQWVIAATLETPMLISTFGEDQAGELYVADFDISIGTINRITPVQPQQVQDPAPPPADTGPAAAAGTGNGNGGGSGCLIGTLINPFHP